MTRYPTLEYDYVDDDSKKKISFVIFVRVFRVIARSCDIQKYAFFNCIMEIFLQSNLSFIKHAHVPPVFD